MPRSTQPFFAFLPENRVAQYLNVYPESVAWFRSHECPLNEAMVQQPVIEALGDDADARLIALALALRLSAWHGDADACCGPMAIDELIDHLIDVHHGYTRAELGRLARVADHLRQGGAAGAWFAAFDRLRRHLLAHLAEEEEQLFPACRQLEASVAARPITSEACNHNLVVMEHGHDEVGHQLDALMELVDELTDEDHADHHAATVMADGLRELAHDLAVHSYKEEEYLLPAALHADELFDARSRARTRAVDSDRGTDDG